MKKKWLCIFLIGLLCLTAYTYPVHTEIQYQPVLYEGQDPSVTVHGYTMFGQEVPMANAEAVYDTDTRTVTASFGGTKTDIPVSEDSAPNTIQYAEKTGITAVYDGTLLYGDKPDDSAVHIYITYADGTKQESECHYELPEIITEDVDVPIQTDGMECMLSLHLENPEQIIAVPTESCYEGSTVPVDLIMVYADGETRKFGEDSVLAGQDSSIETAYGTAVFQDAVIPIKEAYIDNMQDPKEGDTLEYAKFHVTYEDGTSQEVNDPSNIAPFTLEKGINHITFFYNGIACTADITARSLTNIERAMPLLQEEIETSEYVHTSDTCFVSVNSVETDTCFYYLTHVIVNEPLQVCAGMSHDTYGGERETPTDAAKRLNWVVGTNGSNFRYSDGKPDMASVRIKNGEIMDDSGNVCNGLEICLLPDGNVFAPTQGMTVYDLLDMGVINTWCCGDTILIQNGKAVNEEIQSLDYRYPRTAFGMVRPCEYYIITAGDGGYEHGMTYTEVRDVLMDNGCIFGKCMDGGGSSALVFEGELINTPATSEERAVSDFLYFID